MGILARSPAGKRVFRVVACLAAVTLVATVLGTSDASASSFPVPPSSTQGVSAHQVLLGTSYALTGPAAPGYDEIPVATNAYFQYVNAHGGVYGRKLKYLILDDQYNPSLTAQVTRKLVLENHVFVDLGPLGTPTMLAAEPFLTAEKVPAMFIASGCDCWSSNKFPYASGFVPPYTDEGKLLGAYVKQHFSGKRIGYLYQNDEFGIDGVKGLDYELPAHSVVSRQTYVATVTALAAGLGDQMAALKAARAQVVVMYTIPAATALALIAAASIGYHPQWVVSYTGSDPPTLTGLLSSFSKGKAGAALLNGMISTQMFPPVAAATNPWASYFRKILARYDPGAPWTGNTELGVAVGYLFTQLLRATGKNLNRASLIRTLESKGSKFKGPWLIPLSYSPTSHYGAQGGEVVQWTNGGSGFNVLTPPETTTVAAKSPIVAYHGAPTSPPRS